MCRSFETNDEAAAIGKFECEKQLTEAIIVFEIGIASGNIVT